MYSITPSHCEKIAFPLFCFRSVCSVYIRIWGSALLVLLLSRFYVPVQVYP